MRKVLLSGVVLALAAAACGSSGSSTASSGSNSGTSGGSSSTPPGAPIKIALLDFETGVYALPDRHDAIELAIDQINAKGGVDGHKLEYTAYDSGILPQQTVTAVLHAVSDKPTVIIGMPVSSGVQAAATDIKNSGIPTIQTGSDTSTDLSQLGVSNMYRGISTVKEESDGMARYIASKHPKTVGQFDDSDLNGQQTMKIIKDDLQAQGISNFVYREVAQTATDATAAALAMKGADIITSIGFPVQDGIFIKQLYQNGITTQDVIGYDGPSIAAYGLAPKAALANDVMLDTCAPQALSTAQAKAFTQAYEAKYPTANILSAGTDVYDAVYLVAQAVKADGGSLAPKDITKALSSVSYDGACGTYHSDSEHNLEHSVQIISGADLSLVAGYTDMKSS